MKKTALLLLIAMAFITSCSDDDDDPKLNKLSFDNETEALVIGETKTFEFNYEPTTVDKPIVTWSSSDENVATVDATGLVTALSAGESTIAILSEESLSASFELTVSAIEVTAITFETASSTVLLGKDVTLQATVAPNDATDKTLTWESSDVSIATVQDGVVTGVSVGTATITAKHGDISATHTVEVLPVAVTSVTITGMPASVLKDRTYQLAAEILPENATDQTIVWASEDSAIVTVDETGLIKGIAVGKANITATSVNGIVATIEANVISGGGGPPPPPGVPAP
ncbi:Ig-like domain-containing protein [Ancylomarina sp. DW003]|nr:Ig-like domain-containing protein [Ancylomarina sp. DW003]MDE5422725.1 Ig-like domain-containing protein [Ancylomarina sp. DW003]